ncbi:UNVERIFIED_CONTAM: Retrovirus-related Pol polyprotein from transposon TNT 1-94 [Sesamum radiatum]|uniref:Retrovirus-related Pol polyprotein from transposon TNT 1-94 n=1 Tax=Sesamum radiatum TaxID=300843 RepID=A0AAW2L8A7_SESRA
MPSLKPIVMFKAAIKYGRDNVSLDTVINGLKSKEMDIKPIRQTNPLVRGRDERPRDDRYRDEKPRDDKYRERRCYNCGGRGHYIKDCRKPKRDNRNNSKHDGDDANFVSDSNGEVYMISDINNVQSSVNMHEWLIDSGCSFHMSPYKEIFSNYKTDNFGFVAMANEKLCGIKGLGDVCVTFDNGYTLTLKNVRHVPDLCHNLMSCSALEEEGLEGRWGRGVMKIMKGALNVFKAERKRNLYMCSVKYDCFTASVSVDDKASLWHRRLGHISLKGLDLLHKNGLLPDKFKDLNFCDDCVLGKQHKVHFPASPYPNSPTSNDILDYVHADVWGPSNVETHGGNKYFLSIIDNMSRKVFVFLMKQKGVKGYRLWVRDQPGLRVVISRNVVFNESEFPCLTKIPRTEEEYNIELTFNKVEETNEDNQQGEGFREETRDIEAGQTNRNSENPEHIDNYSLARDRERRERRIPSRFRDFHLALNSEDSEPTSYDDALKSPKSEFWIKAMKEEMKSLKDNKTWVLVPKPKNTSIVDSKWIFKLKNENDSLRYKARLVAKGFTQKEGIDYTEIFSPVVKYTTVRIILALTAHFDWELKQMDVKTAFLHGDLDENIYMAQPCGFIDNRNPEHVCLLKKSLYGLKQSPRQWNKKFDNFMKTLMFHKSAYDPCLYFKFVNNAPIFLVLYVDDMLIASPDLSMIEKLQNDLRKTFEMKDLGNAKKILGMTIDRDRKTSSIFLNQKAYVISVLEKFSMINAKSSSVPLAPHFQLSKDQSPKSDSEKKLMEKVPYSNAIGSVMYLMVCTRPDIAYAVSCLSRYMSNAGPPHWEALKWLLRYLSGSANTGIKFSRSSKGVNLVGYVDSNYANDRDSRKSTTSYIFTLCGSCISWKSQLQNIVALSTTEAEYIATTEAFKEAMWLEGLLKEIGFLNNKELVSLSLQVPHRRPAMMIARDPYLGPGSSPQVLVQGGE